MPCACALGERRVSGIVCSGFGAGDADILDGIIEPIRAFLTTGRLFCDSDMTFVDEIAFTLKGKGAVEAIIDDGVGSSTKTITCRGSMERINLHPRYRACDSLCIKMRFIGSVSLGGITCRYSSKS